MISAARVQTVAVLVSIVLLATAALGYLVVPAAMLSVVGIVGTPTSEFLVRTLAAAFLGMLPMVWSARRRTEAAVERTILAGLALYMVAGSAVDFQAYWTGVVGTAAIPSVGFRVELGIVSGWLALMG